MLPVDCLQVSDGFYMTHPNLKCLTGRAPLWHRQRKQPGMQPPWPVALHTP